VLVLGGHGFVRVEGEQVRAECGENLPDLAQEDPEHIEFLRPLASRRPLASLPVCVRLCEVGHAAGQRQQRGADDGAHRHEEGLDFQLACEQLPEMQH